MRPDFLPPNVVEALKLGRPVEAVKRLRKATGMGLAEAKSVVDAFSSGNTAYQPPLPAQLPRRDRDVFAKAEPETEHRQQHFTPAAQPAPSRGGLGPGEVPRSNAAAFWIVLLLATAIAGYYLL